MAVCVMDLADELDQAARDGNEAAVRQLLAAGAPADQPNQHGFLPLHFASYSGHAGVVRLLLEAAPATVTVTDSHGQTALHHAAKGSRRSPAAAVVRLLLEAAPATTLAVDSSGSTPLHRAAECGDIEVVKLLLFAAPAAALILDDEQHAPIHFAATSHNAAGMQLLLEVSP